MEKRILTIQDFSCLGRCSLTVALPTISACGVEAVCLPTAVLSNHTAFPSWTYKDLTEEMKPIYEKWQSYNIHFDTIYTGYLSTAQIPTVIDIIHAFRKKDTLVFVDPAMADRGKLYAGFATEHIAEMRKLLKEANIIKPNLTEACLLTDTKYPGSEENVPLTFYSDLAEKLSAFGPDYVIISGQNLKPHRVADILFDKKEKKLTVYETDCHEGKYHGTGDLFASALAGALTRGISLRESIVIAHDYVHQALGHNRKDQVDGLLFGPEFELAIPYLVNAIKEKTKDLA